MQRARHYMRAALHRRRALVASSFTKDAAFSMAWGIQMATVTTARCRGGHHNALQANKRALVRRSISAVGALTTSRRTIHISTQTRVSGRNSEGGHWCTTMAEAQVRLQQLLSHVAAQHREQATIKSETEVSEKTVADVATLASQWWNEAQLCLFVPRDVFAIEDLPMFLLEALRGDVTGAAAPASNNRFVHMSDDAIVDEFDDWVLMNTPARSSSDSDDAGVIPYVTLLGLIESYARYHRGVRWGASDRPEPGREGRGNRASYYRTVYYLRPWHGIYCPDGHSAQMPYVHVLQWMLAGHKELGEERWRRHKALEPFSPPSSTDFTALDVCCQSGFGVDLLLKAGAGIVVAVDAAGRALGSTEATVHEHLREKRSGSSTAGRVVRTLQCDVIPPTTVFHPSAPPQLYSKSSQSSGIGNARTFTNAAQERRLRARQGGRGFAESSSNDASEKSCSNASSGPFDVIYYHPPPPEPLVSLDLAQTVPSRSSAWWRHVRSHLRDKNSSLMPLVAPTAAAPHPHTSLSVLERLVQSLQRDVTQRSTSPLSTTEAALLKEGGYVVMVLPRTYTPHDLLHGGPPYSLADWVLAQLDGLYDVVLRRRYGAGQQDQRSFGGRVQLATLLAQHLDVGGTRADMSIVTSRLYAEQWVDLLVLKKNVQASLLAEASRLQQQRGNASASQASELQRLARIVEERRTLAEEEQQHVQSAHVRAPLEEVAQGVEWRDSFEHCEYKPRSSPGTQYHWTDLVPTYSYLEDDFYGKKDAVVKNFLAVGHPPQLLKSGESTLTSTQRGASGYSPLPTSSEGETTTSASATAAAAARAAAAFKSVFAEELRAKRKGKLRKLALSPLEQQEWYIDEKLIKSEAAKVEFMNELSRWDLKDYD